MSKADYARIEFGASAVLFGAIALLWHDVDTWQNVHHVWSLPFGAIVGAILMAAQIAGGIGMVYPRTMRRAAIVLGVVYLSFSLACVSDTIAAASVYDKYGGSFFLFLSLVWGATALYAATEANAARAAVLGGIARIGLGICAISFLLGQALALRDTAAAVPKWIPPSPMFWAILTSVAFGLAAIAILTNRLARLAMRLMALMVGLFGMLVWVPHLMARPTTHFLWSELAETLLVAGAAWVVAEGRPDQAG
jgi:hypothetical protein